MMKREHLEWTSAASQLQGPGFARFQLELTKFNRRRFQPALPSPAWREELVDESFVARAEGEFVEAARREVAPLLTGVPVSMASHNSNTWSNPMVSHPGDRGRSRLR